jgi:hypothetical protein
MEQWVTILVAAAILAAAVTLSFWHLHVRRGHRRADLTPGQYDFYRRQFRRRIQISAMLGLLAVTLAGSSWPLPRLVEVLLLLVMLLLVAWIVLLALVDALASRLHFDRLRNEYVIEQAKLEVKARQLRSVGGNGRSRGEPPHRGDGHPRQ